jgi:hypothetical protein
MAASGGSEAFDAVGRRRYAVPEIEGAVIGKFIANMHLMKSLNAGKARPARSCRFTLMQTTAGSRVGSYLDNDGSPHRFRDGPLLGDL